MRLVYFFLALIIATAANGSVLKRVGKHYRPSIRTRTELLKYERDLQVNMNDYVDKVLANVEDFLIEDGLDPAKLDNVDQSFNVTDVIGIDWHGDLLLTKGWAQDLSTIYRSGDVTVDLDGDTMLLTANLGFKDLVFDYDFSAKFMNIGPTGSVEGKGTDDEVLLVVLVNLTAGTVEMEDFKITRVGDIDLEFTGMGDVADWIVTQLSNVVVLIAKGPIIDEIQSILKGSIESILSSINIGDFLPPDH